MWSSPAQHMHALVVNGCSKNGAITLLHMAPSIWTKFLRHNNCVHLQGLGLSYLSLVLGYTIEPVLLLCGDCATMFTTTKSFFATFVSFLPSSPQHLLMVLFLWAWLTCSKDLCTNFLLDHGQTTMMVIDTSQHQWRLRPPLGRPSIPPTMSAASLGFSRHQSRQSTATRHLAPAGPMSTRCQLLDHRVHDASHHQLGRPLPMR